MYSASRRGYIGADINKTFGDIAVSMSNSDVELFDTGTPDPYRDIYMVPTRNGQVAVQYSWNNEKYSTMSIKKIYRILSDTPPTGFYDEWNEDLPPGQILTGLSSISCKDITNDTTAASGNLYREYIDADINSGKTVVFLMVYYYNNQLWASYKYLFATIENRCISPAPSVSFNQATGKLSIGTSKQGRRIIEFYRRDRDYGYPTNISDEETLNEFQYTALLNMENDSNSMAIYNAYYYNVRYSEINKWAPGQYTVGVQFNGTQNRTTINNGINGAISQLNNILNDYGVYFSRSGTAGDITVTVDTEYNLFGVDLDTADYIYGGKWSVETYNGNIISADIKLANDFFEVAPFCRYETVALEEMTQAMGAGYDQSEYPYNTLHTNFNYLNKQSVLSTKDKNILRLLYSDYVSVKDDCVTVSKKLNLPKGAYCHTASTSNSVQEVPLTFLDPGGKYSVRAWIVDSGGYMSYTSGWINITVPELGNVTNLRYSNRRNGGAVFAWDGAALADGYELQAVRNYDGRTTNFSLSSTQITLSTLSTGTTYTIKVRAYTTAYGTKQYSDWTSIQFTTNPSRPQINILSTKNGSIEVDWALEDTTSDYTYIWINIYETEDAEESLVGTTIESGSGKSGHVTLIIPSEDWNIADGETFYLKAQVMYYDEYVSGENLKCLTNSGEEYKAVQYIIVSSRPSYFEWDTPKTGKRFKITTTETNRLQGNINDVRGYMSYSEYPFSVISVGMSLSASMYNSWVNAIQGISGYGTYLQHVAAGDKITASLLNAVVDELNAIEREES